MQMLQVLQWDGCRKETDYYENSYFAEHPEMMLGSMEYDTRIYGQDSRYTVCVNNDEKR